MTKSERIEFQNKLNSIMDKQTKLKTVAGRALRCRCPNCGEGKLFARYLKQVDKCQVCAEEFGHIRADDGPAWLSILVVGHILVPLAVLLDARTNWPDWMTMTVWPTLAVILTLLFLPMAKGLFIALIWRTKCVGSEKH
jgi:uncharacterized protein (DUF983 family)